jgi:predicted ATP-grasp superfamily ATP-dependent carboligase/CelD/BcsL family acetyltransferase involved in cellulose biosynthesis
MLAAERSLYGAGFDVTAVASSKVAPGLWSRAAAARRVLPAPRESVGGFIDGLEEIVRATRHDALLVGTDASLLVISLHRDRLAPYVRLGLPDHDAVDRSLNRSHVMAAAAQVGLASPDNTICETPRQAADFADAIGYPVIVKPVRTVTLVNGAARRDASAFAADAGSVRRLAAALGRCVVQRRVVGSVVSFGGIQGRNGLLAFVVSRYVRTWPVDVGSACFSETIMPPPGLVERVEALVAAIGAIGVFELELIDRGQGQLAAIDLNPRPYGSLALAEAAGVPLAALWCNELVGRPPVRAVARLHVRYRWEDADLRHALKDARLGNTKAMVDVLKPRVRVTHAYMRTADPAPVLARSAQLLVRARRRGRQDETSLTPPTEPIASLEDARERWRLIEERADNVFSTWDWADVWWQQFGGNRALELHSVECNEGPAILPLYRERRAGLTLRRLIGHGVGDQLGPVCGPADTADALRALRTVADNSGVLLVERVRADDDPEQLLGGPVINRDRCPYIDLARIGGWDGFLATHSGEHRRQVRRRARRLDKLGITIRLADDPARLDADFGSMITLHNAHWGAATTAFQGRRGAFHRAFAHRALERGWLRLWLAEKDGITVAAWYGLRFAGVESFYQSGRDPAWDRASVGTTLLDHSIEQAARDGMREYRMLRGDERYKQRYTQAAVPLSTIAVPRGVGGNASVAAVRVVSRVAAGRRLLNGLQD